MLLNNSTSINKIRFLTFGIRPDFSCTKASTFSSLIRSFSATEAISTFSETVAALSRGCWAKTCVSSAVSRITAARRRPRGGCNGLVATSFPFLSLGSWSVMCLRNKWSVRKTALQIEHFNGLHRQKSFTVNSHKAVLKFILLTAHAILIPYFTALGRSGPFNNFKIHY